MAESWGKPTPAIILVVQIDPGPIPTLIASAPARTRSNAASPVAIFPTTTSRFGYCFLTSFNKSITPLECPWAVSITIASTLDFTKASILSKVSLDIPTAAATLNLPNLSLQLFGCCFTLMISLNVIKPTKKSFLSITGNFSILWFWRIFSAFTKSTSSFAVTRFSVVITSTIFLFNFFSNLKSLFVTIPFNFLSLLITGIPPILFSAINLKASPTKASSLSVIGSNIIPLSDLLTFLTSLACLSIDMFLWITPIPPCCAIDMASSCSVTVSIAAEIMGVFMTIFLVNLDPKFTSWGKFSE